MTPGANDLCVFAVKRGNIKERFDVRNLLYSQTIVRHDYQKATLGSLTSEEPCYGTSATAIKRTDESQPKYIRITDFDDFGIEANHEFMTAESYSDKHFLKEGDILFARTGATVGKTYYYDGSIGEAVFAGYCIRFKFDPNKVLPKYVYWMTKTKTYEKWVQGIQRPSGQPNINKDEYKSYEIVLPRIDTQSRLSETMNAAGERCVKKIEQANILLEEMDNVFHQLLGIEENTNERATVFATKMREAIHSRIDPEFHNPVFTNKVKVINKQKYDSLGNIVYFSTETWNQKDFFNSTFPYIEISNVQLKSNEYYTTDVKTETAPSRAKMIVRNGDIIVSTTRPHRGAIATIKCPNEEIQIASTGFCVLRELKRNDVLKEYLQWILLDDYVLLQMLQRSSGGNYPAITAEELKKIVIPIPDIKTQRQICIEANRRKEMANKLRIEAEQEWAEAKAQFERELLGET